MHIQFESAIEQQLHGLALQSGQDKATLVTLAVKNYLQDIADANKAADIVSQHNRRWTLDEAQRELGLTPNEGNA